MSIAGLRIKLVTAVKSSPVKFGIGMGVIVFIVGAGAVQVSRNNRTSGTASRPEITDVLTVNPTQDVPKEDEKVNLEAPRPVQPTTHFTPPNASPTPKPSYSEKINFKTKGLPTPEQQQKILSRVAEPLLYFQETVLKLELREIIITGTTDANYDYELSYRYVNNGPDTEYGFMFGGQRGAVVEYWLPQLCDHGGCMAYPQDFKSKFPETYKAYIACKDKEQTAYVCLRP